MKSDWERERSWRRVERRLGGRGGLVWADGFVLYCTVQYVRSVVLEVDRLLDA